MESFEIGLKKIMKNNIKIEDKLSTFVGKYRNNQKFLGELICQTLPSITLVGDKLSKTKLIDGNFYKVTGKLDLAPDNFSDKAKYYLQLKVQDIIEITKDDPYELKEYLEAKNKIEKIIGKRKKEELLTEKKIIEILGQYKKLNFLYVVSKKGEKETTDILDDLYGSSNQREILSNYFSVDFMGEENILRAKFCIEEWQKTLAEIKKYLGLKNYSALVFIKGGGSTTSFFDDELFCLSVLELEIPIITAVGHSKDDERLLCQLADINYKTPSYLGQNFIRLFNYSQKNKNTNEEKQELLLLKEKISKLQQNRNSLEEDIKSLNRKIKLKNIVLLFLIPLVILCNMIYLYFSNPKKEITQQEPVKAGIKKDIQSLKDENSALIEKVQEKISEKVEDKKKIVKVEKKKRLVYSEDDVYTILLWKGYKGEKAINNFQRDSGMRVTGKVDEALLKKLGVKYKYE